jgi:hypothetical protein
MRDFSEIRNPHPDSRCNVWASGHHDFGRGKLRPRRKCECGAPNPNLVHADNDG